MLYGESWENHYFSDLTVSVSQLHKELSDVSDVFAKIIEQSEKRQNVTHNLIEALRISIRKYPALCLDPAIITALNSFADLYEGE